ncbi:MAG: hypothetical protein IFNCLDLE_02608 [Ignavibacteriaceae bacterium]|nr:hypothetical protein [Ignavibacteriaceae bacterium]
MTAQYGQRSTLSASELDLHINIEDMIAKYPDPRRELLKRLNGKNFKAEVKSHKYEWSVRDNRPIKAKVVNLTVASDATSMIVDTAGVFNVDDVFRKPSGELCVVTQVTGGTNITFRTLSGTPEALEAGDDLVVVGGATAQGKKADSMVSTGKEDLFNYTQIFEDVVDLSGTEHAALIRGEENSGQLIARKQLELTEKLQNTLIIGARTKDDSMKTYTMGGIKYMIDTYAPGNVIDFGGSGTWSADTSVIAKLDDAFDKIAAKNFEKPVMYVGAKFMRKFKLVQDDRARTTPTDKSRGVGVVDTYMSHLFGNVDIVLIQERAGLMDDLVFVVDESTIGYKAMRNRGWFTSPLAKDGDSYKWQILGEYTFKMDIPEAAVYLHNLGV